LPKELHARIPVAGRWAWFLLTCSACATPSQGELPRNPRTAREGAPGAPFADLGPVARNYVTTPGAKGVVGGAKTHALAAEITSTLAARGASPHPDDALATTAGILLDWAARGKTANAVDVEGIARHLGFAGSILSASAFPLGTTGSAESWRQALSEIAPNLPVTRYGIRVDEDASAAAVVFGDVSISLDPVPRHLAIGGSLRLRGELAARFQFGHVYVTEPEGAVRELPVANRRIDVAIALPRRGTYRVEIMGDGVTGPSIVMNVPIYVGMDGDARDLRLSTGAQTDALSAAQFEARMLELLNAARVASGLAPLIADAQLRTVAVAHSQDMERSHFFGHVSPTTKTVAERLEHAGIEVSTAGENLSQASTPEESHQGLMDSPGHRANMLGAKFTHVGIGVVRTAGAPPRFLATLVFARRPPAGQAWTAGDAIHAIAALRQARGARAVETDPALRTAAEIGMKAYVASPSPAAAAAAAGTAFTREAARGESAKRTRRAMCAHFFEILDPDQLSAIPVVTDPHVLRIGVAVHARIEAGTTKFAVLLLSEGGACDAR
jgi:Cysteine-rich secretory protein family